MRDLHALFLEHLVQHDAPEAFLALWQAAPDESAGGMWAIDYPNPTL